MEGAYQCHCPKGEEWNDANKCRIGLIEIDGTPMPNEWEKPG